MLRRYAKNCLLEILFVFRVPANNQLKRVGRSVALLNALRARLDDGGDQLNDTLDDTQTGCGECQINEKLRAALMLLETTLDIRQMSVCQVPINEPISVGRMLTMKTARRDSHLDRHRNKAIGLRASEILHPLPKL